MRQKITLFLTVLSLFICAHRVSAQLILSENFDGTSTWTTSVVSGSYSWYLVTSGGYSGYPSASYGGLYPHSGTYMACYPSFYASSGSYATLNSTAMNLSTYGSTGENRVSFWMWRDAYSYTTSYDSVGLYINTSTSLTGAVCLGDINRSYSLSPAVSPGNAWYQYTYVIPASFSTSSSVYLLFKGYSAYGEDMMIDDVVVQHFSPCAGVPYAGTLNGPTHKCANAVFTLTDTIPTTVTGLSFQWQKRPAGPGAWTNIAGATSNSYTTSITTSTDYRCYIICATSGFSDTSAVKSVAVDSFIRCYCALPTTGTVIGGSTPPTVDSLSILGTTLKNATHSAFSGNYGQVYDSVTQTRAVVSRGGTYTLYAKYGGASSYGMLWIDWNQSGTFNDTAGAEYYTINSSLQSNGLITFTVPITARLGRTGLRVRSSATYSPSSGYACSNFGTSTGAGETVDYVITVVNPPTVDLGVTAITSPPITVTYCPNKADTINATILNYGSTPQSNFYIYAKYVGAVTDSIFTVYTGTLASLASANIYIGTIDPPLGGKYSLQVYTVTTGDMVGLNDTMYSTFNLYPLPTDPVVKSDTVCPGGTAHISVAPSYMTQYKWYRVPTGGTAFDSTTYIKSVVAPAADSTYYIVATDSTTKCVGNRVPVTAAMRPKPVVDLGPDSTLCESPTFFLDAGNPGGSKYAWNTGDTTRKINPRLSGTYYVNVFHYCTVTDSVNLVINPLPYADGIDYVRTGNTYAFDLSGVLYTDSYKWFFGDGTTSTDPTPIHTYSTTGPYSVMVVLYNACGADTISWGVPNKVKNIGVQNGDINLYPNPANNILTVSAGDNTTLKQIIIVNAIGSVVYTKEIDNEKSLKIDVSVLPQGQYILRAGTNQGTSSRMFDVLHR